LLRKNPLADIHNIRSIDIVVARGRRVDLAALPEKRIFYLGPGWVPEINDGEKASGTATAVTVEDSSSVSGNTGMTNTEPPDPDEDVLGDNLPVASVRQSQLGKLIIVMESGQQWRQLNSDNTRITLPADRVGLTADIRQAFLGSISMSLGEGKRSFKVSRIK